jgi:hypothetical protein
LTDIKVSGEDIPSYGFPVQEYFDIVAEESVGEKLKFVLSLSEPERFLLYNYAMFYSAHKGKDGSWEEADRFASTIIMGYRRYGENPEFYKYKQATKEKYGVQCKEPQSWAGIMPFRGRRRP